MLRVAMAKQNVAGGDFTQMQHSSLAPRDGLSNMDALTSGKNRANSSLPSSNLKRLRRLMEP